jgi:hypothetical protein
MRVAKCCLWLIREFFCPEDYLMYRNTLHHTMLIQHLYQMIKFIENDKIII